MKATKETSTVPRIRMNPGQDDDAGSPRTETVRFTVGERPPSGSALESINSQYRVLEKIGDGGMGVVYLATDRKLDRFVAIKRLNRASMSRPALRERFLREAKVVASLHHANIVHVYGLGEDSDGPYIVMEYVAGPSYCSPDHSPPAPFSLSDHVHRDGPMRLGDAVDLLLKLCPAVEYAHSCGIIHRDLKPSNILLDESEEPKIVDFGLARVLTPGEDPITVQGERMLSVGYGAPEQESDATVADERADVYGLGAILYFSITGQNPRYFRENAVPESIRSIIVKTLETNRNHRWTSVKELEDALLIIKSPTTIITPTTKTTWRCKWCDTVNSVALQYCSRCGWDGAVACMECGALSRIGIQFCGACGADLRNYELATNVLNRLRELRDEKSHDMVVQHSSRITGFTPAGSRGAALVERIAELRDQSQRALERIGKLRKLIREELDAEHHERARDHIHEYNTLCVDNAFVREQKELPDLMLRRDAARIRAAIEERNYGYAERTCESVLRNQAPGNVEITNLLRRVHHRRRIQRTTRIAASVLVFVTLYVLSAAPVLALAGRPRSRILTMAYAPATWLAETRMLSPALQRYANLWANDPP